MSEVLEIEIAQDYRDIKLKWEMIKLSIRNWSTQQERKQKASNNKLHALEWKLKLMEESQHLCVPFVDNSDDILSLK